MFHVYYFSFVDFFPAAKILFLLEKSAIGVAGGDSFFPVLFQLYLFYGAKERAGLFSADLKAGAGITQ
jgi:hypothetical protein